MANIFDKDNAALMSFGKVMSRMAAQPLDISEIWYDKTELETYAASDATAYAGQKVTYVDQENNKVYQYSIQTDGTLKEIGVAPTGDETSITVSAEGLVAMFGFAGAETGSVPVKDAETGKLAWKTLEEIGAGDGNDDTTYEFTALKKTTGEGETAVEEIYGITIQAKFNGQNQGDPISIAFDVYTKAEADAKFALKGEDAYDDTELAGRVKAIEDDYLKTADMYDDTALAARVKTLEDAGYIDSTALEPYAKTEDVNTELAKKADKDAYNQTVEDLDALEAKVDAFLTGTGATDALDSLQELIEYINTHDDVEISSILEDIQALENKLAGVDTTVVTYVTAAIDALKIGEYAKAADLTALAGRVEVLEAKPFDTYATIEALNEVRATAEAAQTKQEVADAIDAKLEAADLNQYATKQEITEAGYAVATEVANTYAQKVDVYTKDEVYSKSETDTAIADAVKSATGGESASDVLIELNNYKKAVNRELWGAEEVADYTATESRIDAIESADAAQDTLIANNTALAQKGVDDAKTANDAIAALTGAGGRFAVIEADVANLKTTTEGHGTTLGDHETRVVAIENAIKDGGSLDLRLDALEAADIAQSTTNTQLQEQITSNKTLLDTLNNTTIPGIQTTLGNKADASSVYTKTDIGTIAEGKTLIDMINEAAAGAEYNDTQVKADIAANADAIATLAGEGNTSTVAKNAADIAALDATLKAAIENDGEGLDSIKELATWIETHGPQAAAMAESITALEAKVDTGDQKVSEYVAAQIAVSAYELPVATLEALGGIKASESITVAEDGTATVAKVTTDVLINGANELVLYGGNSKVTTEA